MQKNTISQPVIKQGRRMRLDDKPREWPRWDDFSDVPMYNTKAVVQQTDVPAPTLRAWERRYKLLTPERAENAYRLYSDRDVALIRWLKNRSEEGVTISHAVALFQHHRQKEHEQETESPNNAVKASASEAYAFEIGIPPTPTGSSEGAFYYDEAGENAPGGRDRFWSSYPVPHNLQLIKENLISIFQDLNEPAAHVLMGSVFSVYKIEQVCTELITPVMWEVGQLWCEGKLTVSVEHFASYFFRALLTNRFHITPGPLQGPLILVCSAPRECHELGPLMLALFLRLRGARVVYLGQSIETVGLLHSIRHLQPALVCLSLTLPELLPEFQMLVHQIARLPEGRPQLAFGGQGFAKIEAVQRAQLPGQFIEGELSEVVGRLHAMVREPKKK